VRLRPALLHGRGARASGAQGDVLGIAAALARPAPGGRPVAAPRVELHLGTGGDAGRIRDQIVTTELTGKVAVISGGGGGLGAAMGHAFAGVGAGVAVLDIDEVAAQETAAAIAERHGVPTMARRVDVGDAASIAAAAGPV